MSVPRRNFLTQVGLGAAVVAGFPSSGLASGTDDSHALSMQAPMISLDDPDTAQGETWDVSWPTRLTGKHKAMFDVPEINGGVGVMRAAIWGRQYMDALKVTRSDLSTVIVIRHAAIFLLMNQEYWTTYEVGKARKLKNDDGKTMQFNPVLPKPGAPTGNGPSMMLDAQIAGGAIALGCNLAFRAVVSLIEKKDKMPNAEARAKAKAMMVPGAIMQPSGIFANVLAQEAGCAFVYAV